MTLLEELNDSSPADLHAFQTKLIADKAELKTREDAFNAAMERRYGSAVQLAYQTKGEDTGTVNIAASNTLGLKIERDKDVKWDQPKLFAVLNGMKPEDAKHYAKLTAEIPEAKFKNAPPDIQKALAEARTVKAGRNKFTFKPTEEAA